VCYFSDFIFTKGNKTKKQQNNKKKIIIIEMKISASHYQRDWTIENKILKQQD
jgi:hypothetical protein